MKRRALAPALAAAASLALLAAPPAAAQSSPPPTPGAIGLAFRRIVNAYQASSPRIDAAARQGDLATAGQGFQEISRQISLLQDEPSLPEAMKPELDVLREGLATTAQAMRGLHACLNDPDSDPAIEAKWQALVEQVDDALLWAEVRLLAFARDAGAGESAVLAASLWQDALQVLLGESPLPAPPAIDPSAAPSLARALRSLPADRAKPPRLLPRHVPRDTPAARAVSAAVAAIAKAETELIEKYAQPNVAGDAARAADLIEAEIRDLRRIPVADCPAGFRKAFGDYGRSRVGIVKAMRDMNALGDTPADKANLAGLVADLGERNRRQVADRAALLREARAAGADTSPLLPLWPDGFARLVLVADGAPKPVAARPATPAQRYTDALAKLSEEFGAASGRAPAGAAGAQARLAAFRTFFAGVRKLDVASLPDDIRLLHDALLKNLAKVGRQLQSLANAAAKSPAEFSAALLSSAAELKSIEGAVKSSVVALRASLARAGADVSALDLDR